MKQLLLTITVLLLTACGTYESKEYRCFEVKDSEMTEIDCNDVR